METVLRKRNSLLNEVNQEMSLQDIPLLKSLKETELLQLELHAQQKRYSRRSVIYCEGARHSGIYVVQRGVVKIYKVGANGKHQVIRFAQKGDIIAYRSLLSNEVACTSAKAYEETVVSLIPYHVLLYLLKRNWNFTHTIMKMMCKELRESNTFVTDIAQKSVRERTAEMLLILKEEFGLDQNSVLQITVTREDLANMVGTVTESLIRVMSEFRNERLLELPGRKIVFLDVAKLGVVANL